MTDKHAYINTYILHVNIHACIHIFCLHIFRNALLKFCFYENKVDGVILHLILKAWHVCCRFIIFSTERHRKCQALI